MVYGYYSPTYPGYNVPGYQSQIPSVPAMPSQAVAQQSQGIVWVQGESGAKSYLMAPNSTALLMDSEASRMYIKSTDAAGMPNMRIFEYTEVGTQQPQVQAQQNMPNYALRDDLNALKAKVDEISDWMEKARSERPGKDKEGSEE